MPHGESRLSSQADQQIIHSILSDGAGSLMASLPSLNNMEAIIVGEGIPMPMRFRFAHLPSNDRPRSDTVSYIDRWSLDTATAGPLSDSVYCWRRQTLGELENSHQSLALD